ncbi:CDP-alcohol phosphatidyltransferase family protein [bacterium]|nr:CDP-alcohol phosphatidyltransferase family protein [bacterium]
MKNKIFNIPNIISLLRLPLAFLIILFSNSFWKFIFLLLSLLADVLDGYLARKLNQTSRLGAILDPLMDKIFVLIVFIFFFIKLDLPFYFIILFFTRDALSSFMTIIPLMMGWHKKLTKIDFKARPLGKNVTTMQFITLLLMMIGNLNWTKISMYVLFVLSIIALIDYSIQAKKIIKQLKNA